MNSRFYLFFSIAILSTFSVLSQEFIAEDIARFRVNGVELSSPFAGGLNSPQFSNADLNDDGLMDVLIFDRIGSAIIPMLRQGDEYIFDPTFVQNFPVIDNFLYMRDYNADGIEDIFCFSTEPGISGLSVYRGKYTNGIIDFDQVLSDDFAFQVLSFRTASGPFTNIAVLNSDIPSIEDIDGDGDLDIVTFNFLGGYVEYYQNMVLEQGGDINEFRFIRADDCYGGFFESGLTEEVQLPEFEGDCANSFAPTTVTTRHAGSTCLNIDHDGDGDFDLLLGDLAFNNITLLENAATTETAYFNRQILNYPDQASEPVNIPIFPGAFYLDVDGDSVKDFVAAPNNINNALDTEDNVWFYKNSGADNNPDLELISKGLFVEDMVDLGTITSPTFADVNADGLQDLIVGTETRFVGGGEKDGRLYLFLNVGSSSDPVFELTDENWLDFQRFNSLAFNFIPTFADLDTDGDLDLYVGESNGTIFQVVNNAGPGAPMDFGPIIPNFQEIDPGQISAPTFFDADNDGLLDMIVGERNGNVNFYKNVGTPNDPCFLADLSAGGNTESFGQIDTRIPPNIVGFSKPTFLETEEGTMIVSGSGHGALQLYEFNQDLESEFALLNESLGETRVGEQVIAAFEDLNNNGFYEVIVGNRRGGLSGFSTDISLGTTSASNPLNRQETIDLLSTLVRDKIQLLHPAPTNITVFSTSGQLMLPTTLGTELDVSRLSSGIYFALLEREGIQYTQKFVKM